MLKSLRNTWLVVLFASIAVLVSGAFVVIKFGGHVFDSCRGTLERVSPSDAESTIDVPVPSSSDLEIRYDEIEGKSVRDKWTPTQYKNVRVVWKRTDAPCSCADIAVKWDAHPNLSPSYLSIFRNTETGTYVVRDAGSTATLAMFRKIDDRGHRLQTNRIADPHNVSMLVFLLSLAALGIAGFNAVRATPYARTMHTWRPATLRPDGLVESESGATLGTLESRARIPAGPVIVNPSAFEGRDVYREVPILTKKDVGRGSHDRWQEGTFRLLRDSRSLAIIATITTGLGLAARILGS